MKHTFRGICGLLTACALIGVVSCTSSPKAGAAGDTAQPGRTLLDAGWTFHLGDITPNDPVIATSFDDASWRKVDLPHDYILEGKYEKSDEKTKRGHGYLPYDVGWYRKRFVIPASDQGKTLRLDFDGAFRDSEVWLNGQRLGKHASGYTPFSYDITKQAKVGGENVIVVRVDPREFEGWWYEGAGIYRHVYLTALAPVHVAQWGTHVVSTVPNGEKGESASADLTIQTSVENNNAAPANCEVVAEILAPDGAVVKKVNASDTAPANGRCEVVQRTPIDHPRLWSIESPNLYQLRTTILQDGQPVDSTTTSFGIRTIHFDPDKGFFLNGKHVRINGVACHQDFAGVGIAVPDSLQAWRVQQLQKFGCNAWRTAHNEPSKAVLEACDRLGMMVMAENRHLGDAYTTHSPKGTTANDLSDLATMIQRDRNHPSIIMWSMCNEEGLQGTSEGVAIFKAMIDVVHRYDQTRPITSAMNRGWLGPNSIADVEDIIGVNYNIDKYDQIHRRHPRKMMFGSECMNDKTTRGEYVDDPATGMRSCYNLSDEGWLAVATRPWMGGAFVWTGFDYKGEPNPYGWPDISNNTGLLDVCGFPKDKAYFFKSCWTDEPMVHLVSSSWSWPGKEGQAIRVLAFSNAKRVELFLNGRTLGTKEMPKNSHAEWQVPYEPGTLLAKASTDGKVVASDELQTTDAPARIQLTTDRKILRADGQDTVVVAVSLLDGKGRIVPNADRRIAFQLSGGGRILGVGNGNPADHDTDKADNRNTFHGHCIAVIRAGTQASEVQVTATSPGIASDQVQFKVE